MPSVSAHKKHQLKRNTLTSITILFTVLLLAVVPVYCAYGADYATYYANDYNILDGTYLSGNLQTSLQNVDSDYFAVGSSASATSVSVHNPSTYGLFGQTAYVSGVTSDLGSDDGVHMVYRSYPSVTSAKTLYAHQEATTIGGSSYFVARPEGADLTGITLSASMDTTGRQLLGRFVHPLIGMSSVPASTWTGFYRAWRTADPAIRYDSYGSGNNGDGTANITWPHVVGFGANRLIMIGISIRTTTVSVLNVTVGSQLATFLRSDIRGTAVEGEIWYLVNPDPGSQTVTVTLSGISKASGGSVSYTGISQTSPIDNHRGLSYGGDVPSISLTTTTDNDWVFSNLAISGTATVVAHGIGQTHRYYDVGTGGSGTSRAGIDGDDRPTTTAGSYIVSWNISWYSDVIAQSAAIRPAPSPAGHVDIDILILKSDGTTRTVIANNVADSAGLTASPATLSGAYSWATYVTLDQTDYLEIDYYVEVTAATPGIAAFLRIDDSALLLSEQTKIANMMLPDEYTAEIELTGTSNPYSWTQVEWVVDGSWTVSAVAVTMQLYNHNIGSYPASGNGFISYTSDATANTEETKAQTITINPQHFRDTAGNWKIRVKGVKAGSAPFDFKADLIEIRATYFSEYTVASEFLFSSMTPNGPTQLDFTVVSEYDVADVSITVQVWNFSSSTYTNSGQGYLRYVSSVANETRTLSISTNPNLCVPNGAAKIKITGVSPTTVQFRQKINRIALALVYVSSGSSNWLTTLMYILPVPFTILFLWFLALRRKKNGERRVQKRAGVFSEQFGMTHDQMRGQKILLEIDPASDYNVALSGFISEAKKKQEPLFILTNKNSGLHSVFSQAENVNFLLLTSKAHYPQQINTKETLLPESDLSVLLDAFTRVQKTEAGKTLNILFDNLSDLILRCEFEKTYNFTRLLLEAISSHETTAVFVFNPKAHDEEIVSSMRGLFNKQLAYSQNGPHLGIL